MADKRIQDLPLVSAITGDTMIPVEQGGTAQRSSGEQWSAYAVASVSGYTATAQTAAATASAAATTATAAATTATTAKQAAEAAAESAEDDAATASSAATAAAADRALAQTAADAAETAADAAETAQAAVTASYAQAMVFRRNLSAGENMDALTTPGMYFKAAGVTVANGVNDRTARVVVFGGNNTGKATALVQVWCDCANKNVHVRQRGLVDNPFGDWQQLATTATVTALAETVAALGTTTDGLGTRTTALETAATALEALTGELGKETTALTAVRRPANNATGNYTFNSKESGTRAQSNYIPIRGPLVCVRMLDSDYALDFVMTAASVNGSAIRVFRTAINGAVTFTPDEEEGYILARYRDEDDESAVIDETGRAAISAAFSVSFFTDQGLTTANAPADALAVGVPLRENTARLGFSAADPPSGNDYTWEIGGISSAGAESNLKTRIRIKGADLPAVYVLRGSTIRCAEGFKFNAALYGSSAATSQSMIRYRSLAGGDYTVPQDSWLRICAGYEDDTPLAESSGGQTVPIPERVNAVIAALTIELVPATVRDVLARVENRQTEQQQTLIPCRYGDITTTTELWAAWDALAAKTAFVTKSYLNDAEHLVSGYRIPMYTVDCSNAHIAPDYSLASGHLYDAPRILVVAGVHGKERDSSIGLLDAMARMLSSSAEAGLLSAAVWDVVPCINPYGYDHDVRTNENAYDINRDYSDWEYEYNDKTYGFVTAEAQLIRGLLAANLYEYLLDFHQVSYGAAEYNPSQGKPGQLVGMCSTNLQPAGTSQADYEAARDRLYMRFDAANLLLSQMCEDRYKVNPTPGEKTFFIWDGTANATLRNFCAGWNDGEGHGYNPEGQTPIHPVRASICMEVSMHAGYYTNTTTAHNDATRDICSNYFGCMMKEVVKLLEEEA